MDGSSSVGGTAANAPGGDLDYRTLVADSADLNTVATIDGVYRYVSPACHRLFGWDPAELEGHHEDDFVHPHDLPSFRAARVALADNELVSTTYRFLCRDGSRRWAETTSRRVDAEGTPLVVSAVRDITERQGQTRSLERQAFTDSLTGVANRTVLMD
nr:PAS domain S-box protein [Actinomycetota bacterium]